MTGKVTEWTEDEEVLASIQENIRLGYMENAGTDDAGEALYRLTEAGRLHIEAKLAVSSKESNNG